MLQYIGLGSVQAAPAADSIAFYSTTTTTDAMPPTVSLYGAAAPACPGTDLRRTIVDPATGATTVAPDQFYLNDYTALYVYADAVDIHCPPAAFYLPVAFSDVFFPDLGDTFTGLQSFQRDADLIYAVFGIARLVVGLILGTGAILERVLHLVFVLALTAALFGYAASRLIAFFVPFAGLERQQRDALLSVFTYSWMSAFWIGLFLGLTHIAAQYQRADGRADGRAHGRRGRGAPQGCPAAARDGGDGRQRRWPGGFRPRSSTPPRAAPRRSNR